MNTALIFAAGVVILGIIIMALMRSASAADDAMDAMAGLTPDERALADAIARDIAELPITVYHRPAEVDAAAGAMWSDGPPRGP